MGNTKSLPICSFEEVQEEIKSNNESFFINTLHESCQHCLIPGTLKAHEEEKKVNSLLSSKYKSKTKVVVYGKNTRDQTVYKKYTQFIKLGISHVQIYAGGMFEWLLLQEIYGDKLFPTIGNEHDLLMFK